MTVDENLFIEEHVELPSGLFNKKMGSVNLPPQLNQAKEWIMTKRESLRPWQEFGKFSFSSQDIN